MTIRLLLFVVLCSGGCVVVRPYQRELLAKRIAANPNPPNTAATMAKVAELGEYAHNPIKGLAVSIGAGTFSRLLYTPRGARALTRFMESSAKASRQSGSLAARGAERAAWMEVANAAKDAGVQVPALPLAADRDGRR